MSSGASVRLAPASPASGPVGSAPDVHPPVDGAAPAATGSATALWALYPARAEAAQRLVQREGVLSASFKELTGTAILTGFALALGAGPAAIGLLASLPLLARLSQLYISWRIERAGRWPRSAFFGAAVGRLSIALAIVFVFLPVRDEVRLAALIAAMTLSSIGTATFDLAFLTWMAELVPRRIRNGFFANRARTQGVFAMGVALVAAALLDRWRAGHPGSLMGFAAVFGVALGFGAVSLVVLRMIPHPRRQQSRLEEVRLRDALAGPVRDASFRPLLHFAAVFGIGIGLLTTHLTVYLLTELHLPFIAVTALSATSTVATAVTSRFWGRLGDHFGTRTVVYAGALLLCTNPLMMLGVPTLGVGLVVAMHLVSGIGTGAFTAPVNTLVMSVAPPAARASYLATFVAVYGAGQALGAMAGGGMLRLASAAGLTPGEGFGVLFTIAALTRLGGSQLLGYFREQGAAPLAHMIRVVARATGMSAPPVDPLLRYGSLHLARLADFIARDR